MPDLQVKTVHFDIYQIFSFLFSQFPMFLKTDSIFESFVSIRVFETIIFEEKIKTLQHGELNFDVREYTTQKKMKSPDPRLSNVHRMQILKIKIGAPYSTIYIVHYT